MRKKTPESFSAVDELLSIKPEKAVKSTTSKNGLKDGWTRATFIIREAHRDKLKRLAYWERKNIQDIVDEALGQYLNDKTPEETP